MLDKFKFDQMTVLEVLEENSGDHQSDKNESLEGHKCVFQISWQSIKIVVANFMLALMDKSDGHQNHKNSS